MLETMNELKKRHAELTVELRKPTEADFANISLDAMRAVLGQYGWRQVNTYGNVATIWEHTEFGSNEQVLLPNNTVLYDHALTMSRIVRIIADATGFIPNAILRDILRAEMDELIAE